MWLINRTEETDPSARGPQPRGGGSIPETQQPGPTSPVRANPPSSENHADVQTRDIKRKGYRTSRARGQPRTITEIGRVVTEQPKFFI